MKNYKDIRHLKESQKGLQKCTVNMFKCLYGLHENCNFPLLMEWFLSICFVLKTFLYCLVTDDQSKAHLTTMKNQHEWILIWYILLKHDTIGDKNN